MAFPNRACLRVTALLAGGAGTFACGGATTNGAAQFQGAMPQDSAALVRAGQRALESTLPKSERPMLEVASFVRDAAGVVVSFLPKPLAPGGGGVVRVFKDGRIVVLERWE
ncbi:MAG: hypothetical protein IPJ95_07670 [Gemmatimonadetes bacterium]|nr:hypothetical protein [Gemmatimonadota bacterium]MBK6779758.1 hypothetical protein [Gemmatimonadota bacterium]MBK7923499.1 hypothetical protein [Gemmatimonadota bacterium]MBK9692169.1 hypothetical protein [Gemmatimonadota bacterium]